jgi:hypothetical protein
MKTLVLASVFLISATSASVLHGQDYSGFGRFGEYLGRRLAEDSGPTPEEIFLQRQLEMIAEAEQQAERRRLLIQRTRDWLTATWQQAGLSYEEAASIAAVFDVEQDQPAINERARREGVDKTVGSALSAYSSHQYLLANKLLVAAGIVAAQSGSGQE